MTHMERHHEHHAKPLDVSDIETARMEASEQRHPHGAEAHMMCDCFRGVHAVALEEAKGIEGNQERIAALRALWEAKVHAGTVAEA